MWKRRILFITPFLIFVIVLFIVTLKTNQKDTLLTNQEIPPNDQVELVYQAIVGDASLQELRLIGCSSTDFEPQTYVLQMPRNWSVTKTVDFLNNISYLIEKDENTSLSVECTVHGVGDDLCADEERKFFMIMNQTSTACFDADTLEMGVLNFPRDEKTDSITSFTASGLSESILRTIFQNFQFQ